MERTRIILDADVIIHFAKAGYLGVLPTILSNYDYVVLSTVYNEIQSDLKDQLDNQMNLLKNIELLLFDPKEDMLKEYVMLTRKMGKGESACMAYCRYSHDVIGSSNLKDIKGYCTKHQLTYLTTIDFLYYAIRNGVITIDQAFQFVKDVVAKGSKLPYTDFDTYVSGVVI
ncbi:MAG: hypothetical protein WCR36_10920 [Bacteroidaceae bacterium]